MVKYRSIQGDCIKQMPTIEGGTVDLVITSPPYADARKKEYSGPTPDKYVEWFTPIAKEIKRVLNPQGTFILNIKEKVVSGERHTYVLQLILALKEMGWLWTEEWCWHKKNCYPGKWPNRFRDSWERCLQFNINKSFKMNQDAVRVPIGSWAENRLKSLSETDQIRDSSKSGSPFGKNVSHWVGRDLVYPTNVLHFATECSNKGHPASFPKPLPEFFIRLFTDKDDLVLDPFQGSGTTGVVALENDRKYVGIELDKKYAQMSKETLRRLNRKNRMMIYKD